MYQEIFQFCRGILKSTISSIFSESNNLTKISSTNIDGEEFLKKLIDWQSNSKLLHEISTLPITNLNNCCVDNFNKYIFCNALNVCIDTFQNDEKWKINRKYRITASRCYNLYTYSKGDWQNKVNNYFWPKEFTSKYTEYGKKEERNARNLYSKHINCDIKQTGLILYQSDTWLSVSPDGIIMVNGEPNRLLEIKCPYKGKEISANSIAEFCKFLTKKNGKFCLRENHMYYAQVQICMSILNLDKCDFVVYCSFNNTFLTICVDYNEKYSKQMLIKLKNIYFTKMVHALCEHGMTYRL